MKGTERNVIKENSGAKTNLFEPGSSAYSEWLVSDPFRALMDVCEYLRCLLEGPWQYTERHQTADTSGRLLNTACLVVCVCMHTVHEYKSVVAESSFCADASVRGYV